MGFADRLNDLGPHDDTVKVAAAAGAFELGGTTRINRLGFGAMQLTGAGVWGAPADRAECIGVLRRAVALGVTFIDTADSYGPFVSEELVKAALHPYPEDLVIATKSGLTRHGPGIWRPLGRPEYLRQQCELSLRHLGLERIELYQLHRIDPKVPLEESLGELVALQQEGKIHHIGLSEVSVDELKQARQHAKIATVQNLYNLAHRDAEAVLDYCEDAEIGFIPWFPLATGQLADAGGPLAEIAQETGHTPAQLALAWLLERSSVMLPIPGTSKLAHLEDNLEAARVTLSDAQFEALAHATAPPAGT